MKLFGGSKGARTGGAATRTAAKPASGAKKSGQMEQRLLSRAGSPELAVMKRTRT